MQKQASKSHEAMNNECKLVPQSVMFKIRGNDKNYEEALEASAKFNRHLHNERKMRIPFIDSQTRVAQTNCMMWLMEYQRTKPDKSSSSYVYEYPCKKWYKRRRQLFDNINESSNFYIFHRHQSYQLTNGSGSNLAGDSASGSAANGQYINENSNSMDSSNFVNTHGAHHNLAKQTSNSNDDYEMNGGGVYASALKHHHNHHLLNDDWPHEDSLENFDTNDHENDSDQDDFDESNKKRKKRGKGGGKAKKIEILNGDDKPYACEKCNVKYKTKAGLNYHNQKCHSANAAANGSATPSAGHNASSHQGQIYHQPSHDENTTNSIFESGGYDDMNSTSSISQAGAQVSSSSAASAQVNATNVSANSSKDAKKCGICFDVEAKLSQQAGAVNAMNEKFISCFECNKPFHPICLQFNAKMLQSVKKYNWLCIECKKCTICGNSENDDKLLFCDDCDRGYHMYCLKPPLSEAPQGDWNCELCSKLN